MKNQPSIIWQGDNLVIVGDDFKPHTINKNTHQNYMDIVKCIQEKRWEDIADLLDVRKTVKSWSQGKITIDNDQCSYAGYPVPAALGDMLMSLIKNKIDCGYFVSFMDNLMQNPSMRSVEQLYTFLERNHMPITEDGCFLAYKAVDHDYMSSFADHVTGEKVRYAIGDKPFMPRNRISDNPDNLCDAGLHACSMEYLKSWSGVHLMTVKINPKDVVSVPKDHNFTKMRVAEMEVIGEVFDEQGNPWFGTRDFDNDVLNMDDYHDLDYDEDEIETIRRQAFESGYNEGYDDGENGFDHDYGGD